MKALIHHLVTIAVLCCVSLAGYVRSADMIQPNSVWRGHDGGGKEELTLTIHERRGDTFRARFEKEGIFVREVTGSVKDDKISWRAKDVQATLGKPGIDCFGTINGDRIDFTIPSRGNATHGNFTLVRVTDQNTAIAQTKPPSSPAPQVTTYKPDETKIKILSEESVNITGWITAPLDVAVPEQIWENLNFLKEALKDERDGKPAANPASYQLGVRLCLKMLENLEARDTATARAGGAAVLHQKSNLTQQNRDHLTWPQFALERDERVERKDNARKADKFMNGHYAVEWNTNTTIMRREMQALYSQFREAMRQKHETK